MEIPDSLRYNLDALIRILLLHVVVVYGRTSAEADTPQYLQEEGDCYEDIPCSSTTSR